MPLLFAYGTLRDEAVQLATFGRRLAGRPDDAIGWERSTVRVENSEFVASSGAEVHANLTPTGSPDHRVAGMVFEISEAELIAADAYEADAGYERRKTALASGGEAWLYLVPASSRGGA